MFSRFRKEDRSEVSEAQTHDLVSTPEEEGKKTDALDAGTTAVGNSSVKRPLLEACPAVQEPKEPGDMRLQSQAADIRSEVAGADRAAAGSGLDADADGGAVAEVGVEGSLHEVISSASIAGPRLMAPRRCHRKRLASPDERARPTTYTAEQRLLLLDTWRRSGLPAKDFAALLGVSTHTLYTWKKRFEDCGPAGLIDRPRGSKKGSRLPEVTKRTILMLKEGHPEWGCQRISDMLARGPALPASATRRESGVHFRWE